MSTLRLFTESGSGEKRVNRNLEIQELRKNKKIKNVYKKRLRKIKKKFYLNK